MVDVSETMGVKNREGLSSQGGGMETGDPPPSILRRRKLEANNDYVDPNDDDVDDFAPRFTATTAPRKVFRSRRELADHYKSDWHRYNLKRKEANLDPLTEDDFRGRMEAALALRKEREQSGKGSGRGHLKDKTKFKVKSSKAKATNQSETEDGTSKDHTHQSQIQTMGDETTTTTTTPDKAAEDVNSSDPHVSVEGDDDMDEGEILREEAEEETVEIDPLRSLFDPPNVPTTCTTVDENLATMRNKYGFFVPDRECLVDAEGLVGYAAEKIWVGHICLYCQKAFRSGRATLSHMEARGHRKIRYEEGVDLDEWEVFYDFTAANKEYLAANATNKSIKKKGKKTMKDGTINEKTNIEAEDQLDGDDDNNDEEWMDVDTDDEGSEKDNGDDDDDLYENYYRDVVEDHGFGVTDLGELILPSGRVVGHRALAKYYVQRFAPREPQRDRAVAAVLEDRYGPGAGVMVALGAGVGPRGHRPGGNGRGILVPSSAGNGNYTVASLYRYRAAVRKSRREEAQGYRQKMRVINNGNKFDKKGNRLVNNVSVAHALR